MMFLSPFPDLAKSSLRVGGYIYPTFSPSKFAAAQLPSLVPTPLTPTSRILTLQLGNVYGLLALIGVAVLYTTTEQRVVRNFVIACAIADVGHLAVTYHVMGHANYVDVGSWNSMAWGNIGVTAFLFVVRVGYLLGLFERKRKTL